MFGYSTQTRNQECGIFQMDCKIRYVADRSKVRLVARGFYQKEGINYEETFSPVAWYTSFRASMALPSMMKWDLHQMDVKTSFLNGVIEEEVYIE